MYPDGVLVMQTDIMENSIAGQIGNLKI